MDNKTRVIVSLAATIVLLPVAYFVAKRVTKADEELWLATTGPVSDETIIIHEDK